MGADHPTTQSTHWYLIGQPVGVDHRTAVTPQGLAIDEQIAATLPANVAQGDELGHRDPQMRAAMIKQSARKSQGKRKRNR
jgi:hypothetical protein